MRVRERNNQVLLRDEPVGMMKKGEYQTERTKNTFVRKYNGFGISKAVIHFLLRKQVKKTTINYTSSNESASLTCLTNTWRLKGEEDQLGDEEPQYFLSRKQIEQAKVNKQTRLGGVTV